MFENLQGGMSKTKIGATLIALSAVLVTLGHGFIGDVSWIDTVTNLITEIGATAVAFGVRDLPILNAPVSK